MGSPIESLALLWADRRCRDLTSVNTPNAAIRERLKSGHRNITTVTPVNDPPVALDDAYTTFTTKEICQRLEANEVPFAEINTREEMFEDPQVKAMGAIVEYEHDVAGSIRQPRPSAQFSETPAGPLLSSPALGAHTEEILIEIGRSTEDIDALWKGEIIPK